MEGFLNDSPKFNNSLLNLLLGLFSIKIVSLKSILRHLIDKTDYFQQLCNSNSSVTVTPTQSCSVVWM